MKIGPLVRSSKDFCHDAARLNSSFTAIKELVQTFPFRPIL